MGMENIAFVPITKIDVEKREVWGILAEERVDKDGEILDYEKSKPHFQAWSEQFEKVTDGKSKGNLRAMHGDVAAGKFIHVGFNDTEKKVEVGAKVVDDQEWKKCREGVYTGFSIGGKYVEKEQDEALKAMRYVAQPVEGSLVDNPCMHGAQFSIVKADGSEEMRKFVGVKEVKKGATEAIQQANEAIVALKAMVAELALLPGEPDTWAIQDILEAIKSTVWAKTTAETKALEDAAVIPGGGPDEPSAAADDTNNDAADEAPELAEDEEVTEKLFRLGSDTPIGWIVQKIGDPSTQRIVRAEQPPVEKTEGATDTTPATEALQKVVQAITTQGESLKALSEGLDKTVGETVTKAVDSAKEELQKAIGAIEKRVEKVEDTPAAVGHPAKPAEKNLETSASGDPDFNQNVESFVKDAVAAGANEKELRLTVAQKLCKAAPQK